jgi:hypothetical protein
VLAGVAAVIFGPGAAGLSVTAALSSVGMAATGVLATGRLAGAFALESASALALGSGALRSWLVVPASGVFAALAGAGDKASDAVGAGGAATSATGAAAIFSGDTFRAALATGCERTKTSDGTTVAKRWFSSTLPDAVAADSPRWVRCQRSSRVFCSIRAERLMRL